MIGWGRLTRYRVKWFTEACGAVALSVALTACGTTVDTGKAIGGAPLTGGNDPGVSGIGQIDAPAGQLSGAASLAVPTSGVVASTNGSAGGASSQAPAGGPSVVSTSPLARASSPGVTDSTITFGVPYVVDSEEANNAIGAGEFQAGDTRPYYDAVVDDVNRSGGVAGRKLVGSYFAVSASKPQSADQQTNAACQHWTQDVKAFVFFDALNELARTCAEKHGMVAISSGTGGSSAVAATFRRYPHFLDPSGIRVDALSAATVSGLARADYYGKKPVIGVVTWDSPNYRTAVRDGTERALTRLGLKTKVVEYVQVPETVGALSGSSASVSSAILKFRSEGVTHAFIVDGPAGVALGSVLTLLWMHAAGSQQYHPRYGFNDYNSAGIYTHDDAPGARYVSAANGSTFTDQGVGTNRRRLDCLAVMRRHGITPEKGTQGYMLHACDNVWFLRAVLGTAKAPVDRDRFVALAEALGSTYRSPLTYRVRLSADQRDGVSAFRLLKMDDGCECWAYTSGLFRREP